MSIAEFRTTAPRLLGVDRIFLYKFGAHFFLVGGDGVRRGLNVGALQDTFDWWPTGGRASWCSTHVSEKGSAPDI